MANITVDWFKFWAGIEPERTAVTTMINGQSYSYGHIQEKGKNLAATFYQDHGIRKGDRIAVISKSCIEYIYLLAAAQKLGFILVPLNYRLTQYELGLLIADADPSIVICSEEYQLQEAQVPLMAMEDVSRMDTGAPLPTINVSESDTAFILYTSGSTGVPKGVRYSHRMLYWNSLNTSISLGISSDSRALVCMPLFHTGGWNVLLTPVLHHGGHIIITEKFEAEGILSALAEYRCNQFMAVPTMLKMMSAISDFKDMALPDLPYIIVGGEAMPLQLIETYENKGIAIRQGFGMTEVGPNLTSLHQSQSTNKIGSIGKPNMYVDVKLVDENRKEVEIGQLGELCFAGPVVMPGYWQNAEATQEAIIDGWLYSGDIAMMDDEGYLYIKDRKKNMFISGAENVYPAEVERVLLTHPAIEGAVVIGVPDAKWGEVGKAFLVLKETSVTIEDIKAYCLSKLSKYKIPKFYEVLEQLPTNSTGKVDRKQLKG